MDEIFTASAENKDQSLFPNAKKDEKEVNVKSKRDEYQTEIRKKTRDEQLMSKRRPNINVQNRLQTMAASGTLSMNPENAQLKEYIDKVLAEKITMEDFFKILEAINSTDRFQQHYGVIGLRKILSIDGPPIQPVIDSNLVPRLIEFMQNDNEPHLQLESAWALTNVASGTSAQTQAIIDKGGIPLFVKLLSSPHTDVAEQAIWAIGNISGDSATYRDQILKCGGLDPLIRLVQNTQNRHTIKHGTWALSNLCRGRPFPKFEKVRNAVGPLAQVIKDEVEDETLTDAAWAMSYLSDGNETVVEIVVNTGLVPALIKHLSHPSLSILIPCLRTLGNIVTGNEKQTNHVLSQPNVAEILLNLLSHSKKPAKREACWVLSNITAGTHEQIEVILRCPGFVQKLNELALTDSQEVRREATWVLSNAINHGTLRQIIQMVEEGVLETLTKQLEKEDDAKLVTVVLESINKILTHGTELVDQFKENPFLNRFDALNGTKMVEKLQEHKSDDVYKAAITILETFYEINDPL